MSSAKFASVLKSSKLRENDRIWFGRWVGVYRKRGGFGPNDRIPVDRDSVIAMLREQKAKGRKAWQRLQIVKAIEYYRFAHLPAQFRHAHAGRRIRYPRRAGIARAQRRDDHSNLHARAESAGDFGQEPTGSKPGSVMSLFVSDRPPKIHRRVCHRHFRSRARCAVPRRGACALAVAGRRELANRQDPVRKWFAGDGMPTDAREGFGLRAHAGFCSTDRYQSLV